MIAKIILENNLICNRTNKILVSTLLVFHSAQGGVSAQLLFLIQVLQVDLCAFMCHAESHFGSSTSNWRPFECSRMLREARVWYSPQLVGWGRVGTCDQRCGWSLGKQGAGHSAPSRRRWFDGALLGVHMATKRVRINGCVGTRRVLPRRKQGQRSRTPVHEAPLRLPCRRPRLALLRMARGSARRTASDLDWLRRGRSHTKRETRRHKGGGRAKRTNNSGRARGSAFVSSNKPSGGRSRRVRRKSSRPPFRGIRYQATNRRWRGSHKKPDSRRSSGEKRRRDATRWKAVPPEPEPKAIELSGSRSKEERLSIATTPCFSREGVSGHPRGTGMRPISKAQDAYDSCGEDHAASNAPGGSQVQAPKTQQEINEETENSFIISELHRKWWDFGHGVRGSWSRVEQRRFGTIEAIPRGAPQVISPNHWKPSGDDGRHPGCIGRSTTTGIGARFGHKVFGQDYNEEILRSFHQCRDESIGRGNGLVDGWPCGTRGRHHGPEVPSPRVRCYRREIVEQSKALETGSFGWCYVSNPRTARRYESPGASRSAMDQEAKQLDPERTGSVSHPSGGEGLRQNGTQWKSIEGNHFGKGNKKGNKAWDSNEQVPGSIELPDAKRPKRVWGPALSQEKREAMNESPPVTHLWLPLRQGCFCEPQKYSVPSITTRARFRLWVDSLSSRKVSYRFRQADLCHAVAMVREFMATVGPVCRSFLLQ